MPRIAFTDLTLRSLKSGERTDFWDTKTAGLGLRVGTRSKVFVAKIQNRRHTLGQYPRLTLQQARRRFFLLKADTPATNALELTLGDAKARFLDTHCASYRPRPLYETKRLLSKLAPLDRKKLSTITTHNINDIIDRQTSSEATHLFKVARTFFLWAMRRRYIPLSPLQGLPIPNKEKSRSRILSDTELKAIWDACDGTFGSIVKLLILTGQRRGEIGALHWEWTDEEKRTISFPASITKNGRAHTIPFGQMTYDVLDSLGSDKLLFIARGKDTPFNSWSKAKVELDKLSSVTNWTLHDIRRTFATRLAEMGIAPHVIERLLNHVTGQISGVAAIYNRARYFDEMRNAIEKWEAHLTKILAG